VTQKPFSGIKAVIFIIEHFVITCVLTVLGVFEFGLYFCKVKMEKYARPRYAKNTRSALADQRSDDGHTEYKKCKMQAHIRIGKPL